MIGCSGSSNGRPSNSPSLPWLPSTRDGGVKVYRREGGKKKMLEEFLKRKTDYPPEKVSKKWHLFLSGKVIFFFFLSNPSLANWFPADFFCRAGNCSVLEVDRALLCPIGTQGVM